VVQAARDGIRNSNHKQLNPNFGSRIGCVLGSGLLTERKLGQNRGIQPSVAPSRAFPRPETGKIAVKNHNLGFIIPYTVDGDERSYIPDFIARIDDGHAEDDLLNLIIEVSGAQRKDKAAKVATAKNLWVTAVNNHGDFGRWAFIEIMDPWDAKSQIRIALDADESVNTPQGNGP